MTTNKYVELLYVEDNMADAELALDSLKEHNLINNIKHLKDGQEVLDYFFNKRNPDETAHYPRLILLDLKLPKVSGLEVLEKLKSEKQLCEIPVVILTSSNEDIDIKRAYQLGANSYIVKPVNFHNFADAIRQLSMYWLVLNRH